MRPSPEEIHVWRAALDWSPSGIQGLRQVLSEEERQHSEAFHFSKDRRHFIVARGLLRMILGRCLDANPALLKFQYGEHGKPALNQDYDGETVQFNLSHSNGLALIAVARNRPVGVDIEFLRPNVDTLQLAGRFFSPGEVAILRSLPENLQEEAFFLGWSRKEAYIKATGLGLSLPLDQFDVSLVPGERAVMLRNDWDPDEIDRWVFYSLPPEPGFAISLVAEAPPARVSCWQLSEDPSWI